MRSLVGMLNVARWRFWWIGVVFFLISVPIGMYVPALSNILAAYEASWALPYAMAVSPAMAIVSSLVFAALADQRVRAERLLSVLSLSSAGFVWLAFASLEWGWNAWWYLGLMAGSALLSGPMWALLIKVAFAHATDASRQFPLFRLWGTVGWIVAGWLVSWWDWDASAQAGMAAGWARVVLAGAALLLPVTVPESGPARDWKDALGLRAFELFKDRSLRVFMLVAMLFAVPLAAHYMFAPRLLGELGSQPEVMNAGGFTGWVMALLPGPTAQMTLGQLTEIGAMLFLAWVGSAARVRVLLALALVLGVARFGLYALAGETGVIAWMWLGVALHGPVYTLFSVTGQMFVDRRVPHRMRGQAHALLRLLEVSLGGTAGAFVVGWWFGYCGVSSARVGAGAWGLFWGVLALMIVGCLIYFLLGYRSRGDRSHDV